MTKTFCDLCEKEVVSNADDRAEIPCFAPYKARGNFGVEEKQCRVTATVRYSFADHQTGFAGPPDLCGDCRQKLINQIAAQSER